MATVKVNTSDYYNNVVSNLETALSQMDSVVDTVNSFNFDDKFRESYNLRLLVNGCSEIRDQLRGLTQWSNETLNKTKNVTEELNSQAMSLPTRTISYREGIQ